MSNRKLPSKAPSKKVMQLLKVEGYVPQPRTSGSHIIFKKDGCRSIPVSASKNIPIPTLRAILKQMGITRKRFFEIWDSL